MQFLIMESTNMFHIYLFIPVADTKMVTIECIKKHYKNLEQAKKVLCAKGEGYIIKYPSSTPVYSNAFGEA